MINYCIDSFRSESIEFIMFVNRLFGSFVFCVVFISYNIWRCRWLQQERQPVMLRNICYATDSTVCDGLVVLHANLTTHILFMTATNEMLAPAEISVCLWVCCRFTRSSSELLWNVYVCYAFNMRTHARANVSCALRKRRTLYIFWRTASVRDVKMQIQSHVRASRKDATKCNP